MKIHKYSFFTLISLLIICSSCDLVNGKSNLVFSYLLYNISTEEFTLKLIEVDRISGTSYNSRYDNTEMYAFEFVAKCEVLKSGYVLVNENNIVTNFKIFNYNIWESTNEFLKSASKYKGAIKVNIGDKIKCQNKVIMKKEKAGWVVLRISQDLY